MVAIGLVAMALYTVAYLGLVDPQTVEAEFTPGTFEWYVIDRYRWPGSSGGEALMAEGRCRMFFLPANAIDRRFVRTDTWTPKPTY